MLLESLEAFKYFMTYPAPLFLLLGTFTGMLFGILPGLGGPQALTLLLPFTFMLDPRHSIILLIGTCGSIAFSGSIPAILINTPGTPQNAATCLDGYPLAQQGKAGYALGAAAVSSALGAVLGVIILIMVLPIGRHIVLAFSYAEYFMLAVLGLSVIILVSEQTLLKGLIAAVFGLILSTFGFDPVSGMIRFNFGSFYLYDGIKLIPVMIGLFAVSEAVELLIKQKSIARRDEFKASFKDTFEGAKEVFKNFYMFLRVSVLGVLIGMVPGVGGVVTNFVAYAHAKQSSKKDNNFGNGDIRGVIAAEAANDSKDGGALVPTLIFGIPGSAVMAVLLGGLTIHGITPGPRLIIDNPQIIYALIYALLFSNIITSIAGLCLVKYMSKITILQPSLVAPIVLVLAFTGSYVMYGIYQDVLVCLIFGAIGFLLKQYNYSRIAVVIALILGELAQISFHQTRILSGIGGFFTRPLSLGLFLLTIILLTVTFMKNQGVKATESQKVGEKG